MSLKIPNPYKDDGSVEIASMYRQLGPGPCNSSMIVMQALLNQPIGLSNKLFYKVLDENREMIKYVYQTKNSFAVVGQMSGNGGNEALVVNLTDPGDTVIVAVAGYWGAKVVDMCKRYGLNTIELSSPPGEIYTFEALEKEIIKHKPVCLYVTQGESSGGTLQPLDGLGAICHKYNCLLVVDAVVSLGVVPLLVDEWEIDAVNAGVQKGIGAPAGAALITMNDKAYERMKSKKHPVPYILDLMVIGDFFAVYNRPRRFACTYGFHMLTCVRQALIEICREGLEECWARHLRISELFMTEAKKIGCKDFITKPENRFPGTNCVVLPGDINWQMVMEYSIKNHHIEFGFGIGPTVGKSLRIGFFASNARPEVVHHFIGVLKEAFEYCRKNPEKAEDCSVTKLMTQWFKFGIVDAKPS